MQTLTEREFFQLSPEDQEKAIAEVMENCRQVRSYAMDVVAEAESLMADKDYANAEAYFVYGLEIGRELSVNKEGLINTTTLIEIKQDDMADLWRSLGNLPKAQSKRHRRSRMLR